MLWGDEILGGDTDDEIRGKLLHYTSHNFSTTGTGVRYIPFNSLSEQTGSTYYSLGTPAPYDGRLVKVQIRSTNSWGSSSNVKLMVTPDGSSSPAVRGSSVTGSVTADTTATRVMASNSVFSAGEVVFIRLYLPSSSTYGDVRMLAVWELDQNS